MKWVLSVISRYLSYITEFDNPIIFENLNKNCRNWLVYTGMYQDMNTRRGVLLTVFSFLNMANQISHTYLMAKTAIMCFSWSVTVSIQIFIYAIFCFTSTTLCLLPLSARRRELSRLCLQAENRFRYTTEMADSLRCEKIRRVRSIFTKYFALIPIMILLTMAFVSLFRPKAQDDSIDGIHFNLPLVIWYPFRIDSWTLYVFVALTQVYTAFNVVLTISTGVFIYILIVVHWLSEMYRLIHSISCLELRSKELFKKRHDVKLHEMMLKEDVELYSNQQFIECYFICIKENIIHHKILLEYIVDYNKMSGLNVLLVFTTSLFLMAATLYSYTYGGFLESKINSVGIGLAQVVSFYIVCTSGQSVTDASIELQSVVYGLKWMQCPKQITQIIKIFLEYTRKPIVVTAFGLVQYDHECFKNLMSNVYKVFNIFRST